MTNSEHHEYLCSILSKLVDSKLTITELSDLSSSLGISIDEFYEDGKSECGDRCQFKY